ncbi:MAG: UvrD-helicase domain-containing protein [Armatimonadetes bacterium]|nr:UvrD-helicase domain-containing protein [Armatimonadota bacterium]
MTMTFSEAQGWPDYPERKAAAESIAHHVILKAGAGSGKTTALIDRYMNILARDEGADVENIAAVTFTNRAAREMKDRLRRCFRERFVEAKSTGRADDMRLWRDRIRKLETAPISTIHSLCTTILQQFPLAAGVDPKFTVMDELDVALQLKRIVEESLLAGIEEDRESAAKVVGYFEGLSSAAAAITSLLERREKYRQWLEREVDAEALEREWAAVEASWLERTVTELANSEQWQGAMAELSRAAGMASSIANDKLADKILAAWDLLKGGLPTTEAELRALMGEFRSRTADYSGSGASRKWETADKRDWARGTLKSVDSLLTPVRVALNQAAIPPSPETVELAAAIWQEARLALEAWDRHKSLLGCLDFDDLQVRVLELLRNNPQARRRIRSRFRHILVDEFQDTSQLQRDLIWALAGIDGVDDGLEPARLFLVGDAKQSIYRFRDADVTVFNRAVKQFAEEEDCATHTLTASVRPNRALMNFFNMVFEHQDMLGSYAEVDYHEPYEAMEAVREYAPIAPPVLGLLVASEAPDLFVRRTAEARAIAFFVKNLLEARPVIYDHAARSYRPLEPGDIAILFRAMTDVFIFEAQLTEAGLPYYNLAGRGFFNRPEVRDIINVLDAISNPRSEIAVVGFLRSPMVAVSDNTLFWLAQHGRSWWDRATLAARNGRDEQPLSHIAAEEFSRLKRAGELLLQWRCEADRLPVATLISRIIDATGYSAAIAAQVDGVRAVANINKLLDLAREFDTRPGGSVAAFVRGMRDLAEEDVAEQQAPTEEAQGPVICLSSVHSAKGLQWPIVIVADLCRGRQQRREIQGIVAHPSYGLIPAEVTDYPRSKFRLIARLAEQAERAEADAEDRRLLYVAMTRASDLLVLTSSVRVKDGSANIREAGEKEEQGKAKIKLWLDRLWAACNLPSEVSAPTEVTCIHQAGVMRWYIVPESALQVPDALTPSSLGLEILPPPEGTPVVEVRQPEGAFASRERADVQLGPTQEAAAPDNSHPDFAAILEPASPDIAARVRFSVTELADYRHCPAFYRLHHIEGLPDIDPQPAAPGPGLTPAELGSFVHRMLQMVGKSGACELDQLVQGIIPGGGLLRDLTDEDLERVVAMVRWFLDTALYRDTIAPARRLRSEARLSIRLNGVLVEGKVDAVAETDMGPVLIDYKTGNMPDASGESGLSADEFQIALYAWGLSQLGTPPAQCVIAYLDARELQHVPLPSASDAAFREARDIIASIRAGQFPGTSVKGRCSRCRLRWACDAAASL